MLVQKNTQIIQSLFQTAKTTAEYFEAKAKLPLIKWDSVMDALQGKTTALNNVLYWQWLHVVEVIQLTPREKKENTLIAALKFNNILILALSKMVKVPVCKIYGDQVAEPEYNRYVVSGV